MTKKSIVLFLSGVGVLILASSFLKFNVFNGLWGVVGFTVDGFDDVIVVRSAGAVVTDCFDGLLPGGVVLSNDGFGEVIVVNTAAVVVNDADVSTASQVTDCAATFVGGGSVVVMTVLVDDVIHNVIIF